MRHFAVYPSADPARGLGCAWKWRDKGYEPLVGLDPAAVFPCNEEGVWRTIPASVTVPAPFPGYYRVISNLAWQAFERGADIVTCVGDDMDPPQQGADVVTALYFQYFNDGYGVMQGTGDKQGMDSHGVPAAARICGSPTFGRGWMERGYGGTGPFHAGYMSFYADEDLWNVARRAGVLWLNPEVTIYHRHWSWGHMRRQPYQARAQENWLADRELFNRRKAEGFP